MKSPLRWEGMRPANVVESSRTGRMDGFPSLSRKPAGIASGSAQAECGWPCCRGGTAAERDRESQQVLPPEECLPGLFRSLVFYLTGVPEELEGCAAGKPRGVTVAQNWTVCPLVYQGLRAKGWGISQTALCLAELAFQHKSCAIFGGWASFQASRFSGGIRPRRDSSRFR